MNAIKEKIWAQIVIIYTRYLLGGSFVFAGVIKMKGKRFTSFSGQEEPMGTAFHLFETLYQSGMYWQFLGIVQIVAGFLLLTQRYARLGAVINLPILVNVFFITLSYDFAYTPVVTGMMLFANILLIAWHWDELKILFNLPPKMAPENRLEHATAWEITGLAMFLFTFGYRLMVDVYDPILWFGICVLIGLAGFIFGMRKRDRQTVHL